MKKNILLSLMIFFFWVTIIYADIYNKGVYWTIDKDNKIVYKNSYPPDEKLLEENKQICIYTNKDIPFDEAEYKNGKIVKRTKTTQEIEDELKRAGKEEEWRVIHKRMIKIAIDELEAEGLSFVYDHLEDVN